MVLKRILLFYVFFLAATLARGKDDPQKVEWCKHQCEGPPQISTKEQEQCKQRCEKQKHGGLIGTEDDLNGQTPKGKLEDCQQHCRQTQQQGQQRQLCMQRCQDRYGRGGSSSDAQEEEQGSRWEGSRQEPQEENPYVLRQHHFKSKMTSQEGYMKVLQRFSKRSNLLRGIENYRLAIYEGNPYTFNLPNHWDADTVVVCLNGRGSITLLEENNKKSYNVERGDILRVRSGVTVHMVNRDSSQKLYIATLVQPVANPGNFQIFNAAGGRDLDSYYEAFSGEILEAAFNVPMERLQKLFQARRKGSIVKGSPEQIQALSGHAEEEEPSPWVLPPFQGKSQRGVYNLFNKRPSHSNEFGKLYEANQDDYKQLEELDVAVAFADITQGAMFGPVYSSRATHIAVVVDGKGYLEMACPHMSSSSEKQGRQQEEEHEQGSSTRYQKMNANVSRGDVFVVPASHPVVIVASRHQNLQVICFAVNAENDKRNPLAGKNNILKQLEREAKELAFDMPARQVEDILEKQDHSWFFPVPHQHQGEQGRVEA